MNAEVRSSTDAALRESFEDDRGIETCPSRPTELISTVDRPESQLGRFAERLFGKVFLERSITE